MIRRLVGISCVLSLVFAGVTVSHAQDIYPKPVSEYAEKTGPGTMTFLSYPKYYQDQKGQLQAVNTNLEFSEDPNWDYEVSKGIWNLKVNANGLFQAGHEGDIFTYRFSEMGVRRNGAFHAFDWGEPNWSEIEVQGDQVYWWNVFPDVDLSVRYIHDILKVDVIVSQALRDRLAKSKALGELMDNDFIAAKFDIPDVFVRSKISQNGESRDLYADNPIDVDQPLEFVKDGNIIHRLRPVETYVIDNNGNRLVGETPEQENAIRSSQRWQLKQNASGEAEIAAHLGDILAAPEGSIVIDPSLTFGTGKACGSGYDATIDDYRPDYAYGAFEGLYLSNSATEEKRILAGFDIDDDLDGKIILTSKLRLYCYYVSNSPQSRTAKAYKVTTSWVEASVTWNSSVNYDSTNDYSPDVDLPLTINQWTEFNVTDAFDAHIASTASDIADKGFLIKTNASTTTRWYFRSRDYGTATYRPELVVNYDYETATFADLNAPVPDNQYAPVQFDEKWYTYITGGQNNANNDNVPKTFVIQINDDDRGMATRDISNISDYLYRSVGTQTPSPQATGTPFPVLEPLAHQSDIISPVTGDWYVRMNALFSHNVGVNASSTPIIHSVFHAEDTHDLHGQPYGIYDYGNGYLHANYARIGYARSENAVDFQIVSMKPNMTTTPTPRQQRTPGPLIECFMSEMDWIYPKGTPTPNATGTPTPVPTYKDWFVSTATPSSVPTYSQLQHGVGVRHPWMIEKDECLYVFYDRNLALQYCQERDQAIENEYELLQAATNQLVQWPSSICVARATKTNVNSYDPTTDDSPWFKYYEYPGGNSGFDQPANGGWSTPILTPSTTSKYRELPSVTKSKYINGEPHLLLSRGIVDNSKYYLYMAASQNSDLTSWSAEIRIDIQDDYINTTDYNIVSAFLVNNDPSNDLEIGSVVECGQEAYLYMGLSGLNGMPRTKYEFSQ
jgi:hypothetical protein